MDPYAYNPRAQAAQAMLGGEPQAAPQLSALEQLNAKRKRQMQEAAGKGGGLLGSIIGGVIGAPGGPAGVSAGVSIGGSLGSMGGNALGGAL